MAILTVAQQTLQFYELKLTPAAVAQIGAALQKLPMEQVYPVVMDLERQIQEQNFLLEQKAIQDKVAETNIQALAIAADQQLNLGPTDSVPEPPVVTFVPESKLIGKRHRGRNGAAHA